MHCVTLESLVRKSNCNVQKIDVDSAIARNSKDGNSDDELTFMQPLSPSHIPKGLNCLCCPKESRPDSAIGGCPIHKCDYSLITEAPKRQLIHIVDAACPMEMKNQISSLTQKLRDTDRERNQLRKKLDEVLVEKERCDMRMEVMITAHESRITEMHCVIAELKKKLEAKVNSIILEENDLDENLSFQEASHGHSDNAVDHNTDCGTELIDMKVELKCDVNFTADKNQIEILQEEVFRLKSQIAYLESHIANKDNVIDIQNSSVSPTYIDEQEKNDLPTYAPDIINCLAQNEMVKNRLTRHKEIVSKYILPAEAQIKGGNVNVEHAVPKMAERVKLKKTFEQSYMDECNQLTNDVQIVEKMDQIVAGTPVSDVFSGCIKSPNQLHNEIHRLHRKVEYLKTKNSIISLTFEECKQHCEHLYLLCGKYESNATALQLALNCSDRAIEAYDVMLALLETKLAVLKENSGSAKESRKNVEVVARHLLDKLESEKNANENSLGPWQNTLCINNSKQLQPWTAQDDERLRSHVSKLKGKRSAAQNTVVTFESPFYNKNDNVDRSDASDTPGEQLNLESILSEEAKPNSYFHALSIQRKLIDALSRESQLKKQVQSLIASSSKINDDKYTQVQNSLSELQKEKRKLLQLLDQQKTEYQSKVIYLERKLEEMRARFEEKKHSSEMVPETTL